MFDAARTLLYTALLLADAAIVAMLILQFRVPIPMALGSVVVINLGLAGQRRCPHPHWVMRITMLCLTFQSLALSAQL
jgi:hypothetical protein